MVKQRGVMYNKESCDVHVTETLHVSVGWTETLPNFCKN